MQRTSNRDWQVTEQGRHDGRSAPPNCQGFLEVELATSAVFTKSSASHGTLVPGFTTSTISASLNAACLANFSLFQPMTRASRILDHAPLDAMLSHREYGHRVGIFRLLEIFEAARTRDVKGQNDIIRVMSLHKSKGLTAKCVLVVGCVAGALPTFASGFSRTR